MYTLVSSGGSVAYGDTVTVADFSIAGRALSEYVNAGAHVSINQNSNDFTLAFTNSFRELTWTGSVSGDWNASAANWSSPDSASEVYGFLDYVTFDDTAVQKNITIAEGIFEAYDVTVSGTNYSFTGALNVYNAFTVNEGASATLNTAPVAMGSATVAGELTLAFGGTWTQDVDASA
ncbi:MAG: hypothetical protein II349_04395, partial [Akkermansia sp.]|nr:hypothetical protein [Akkermansia sp.]